MIFNVSIWWLLPFFFYILFALTIIFGSLIRYREEISETPTVSVIICARDEEDALPGCLDSLTLLNYPKEKLEIILVDDRSMDRTGQLIKEFAKKHSHTETIHITEEPSTTGKINGLVNGSRLAKGAFLFYTDADCIVPENWIRTGLAAYQDQTGLTAGYLILDRKGEPYPILTRLQSLDWILIATVGMGWSNLSLPLSIFGNNFSIRRDTYQQAGGFENVGNHITEDFAIMRNVKNNTKWKIRFLLHPEFTVFTHAAENFREFLSQRKRWAIGCRDRGLISLSIMITAFAAHVTVLLHIASGDWTFSLAGFLLLLLSDFFLFLKPLKVLQRLDLLRYLLLYELFYFGYTVLFAPFLFFSKKVEWKSSHLNLQLKKPAKNTKNTEKKYTK